MKVIFDFKTLFLIHFAATWYMTGVILLVQLVHYPSFSFVDPSKDRLFHKFYVFRISWVVMVPMVLEIITGILLLGTADRGIFLLGLNGVLIVLIWCSTAFFQVPEHRKLEKGFDAAAHQRLVRTNSVRTLLWMARAAILSYFFLKFV